MKKYKYFFSSKFVILFLFIWSISFHSHIILTKEILFYRELISFLILILSIWYLIKFKIWGEIFKKEILILLIPYSIFFLIVIFNPGDIDPEFVKSSRVLTTDLNDNVLILYIIRNFALFIPILFFLFLKGLSENEIHTILKFFFVLGILNFYFFINNSIEFNKINLHEFIAYNNIYSENNNFTPLISGLFSIGIYLSFKEKNYYLFFFFTSLCSFYFYLIFLSSGKAAMLFSLLSLLFFIFVFFKKIKKIFLFLLILNCLFLIFHYSLKYYVNYEKEEIKTKLEGEGYNILYEGGIIECQTNLDLCLKMKRRMIADNEFVYPIFDKKLTRFSLGPRIEIYKEFFNYLETTYDDKKKFLFGTGSLSMMFSGFHNDFMRVYYRVGAIGLIFSFIPIFYFFFRFLLFSYERFFYEKKTDTVYILFILLAFIPYFSLFAYPRESTYQSGTFWLSMFLVYGYLKNNNKKYN